MLDTIVATVAQLSCLFERKLGALKNERIKRGSNRLKKRKT